MHAAWAAHTSAGATYLHHCRAVPAARGVCYQQTVKPVATMHGRPQHPTVLDTCACAHRQHLAAPPQAHGEAPQVRTCRQVVAGRGNNSVRHEQPLQARAGGDSQLNMHVPRTCI
jgi:hypothetical protein